MFGGGLGEILKHPFFFKKIFFLGFLFVNI